MARDGVLILTPRDRAAWLAARKRDVTASTIGALFGVHDFLSPLELWALKTGRIRESDEENEAMRRGRLLEPVAVQILKETRPEWLIHHNAAENVYYRDPVARIGATPDVLADCPRRGLGVVQIKSVEAGVYRRKWLVDGPEEPPEVPFWIVLQAMLEAYLVGAKWAAVAPLVIGFTVDIPVIDIPLDHMEGVAGAMKEKVAGFWQMVAEDREPPVDYAQDAALVDRLFAVGDAREEVDLTADNRIPELLDTIRGMALIAKEAEAKKRAAEAEIKSKMGAAEVAHIAGGRTITWKTHRKPQTTIAASTYRVLRLPTP